MKTKSAARSATSTWTIRYMEPRDLTHVFRITQRTPAPRWARQDFLLGFQSRDICSWVAEVNNEVIAFVVCRVMPRGTVVPVKAGNNDAQVWRKDTPVKPTVFELLHIAVAPEYQRQSIGRALLGRFDERLRKPDDCIRATVPERNLSMQLFLRTLGYEAVRVLRDYYGDEDAYLMERRIG